MDFRVDNLPKVRVLLKRDAGPWWTKLAVRVAGFGSRMLERLRPAAIWLYGLRRRVATISVMALTVWLFAHVMLGANGMMVYQAKRAELQGLQKEIDSLQKENNKFGKQINDLKTDPKTIEKAAREQLHYARPGEVVYVTPPPPPVQEAPRTDSARN
ncbi:MAG: FtsB family cell division protein [Terriglobales bacterium]